ncbi:MAG TPA: hypothetical protein VF533_20335, partial [Solirubrobacteraceae bacterium]
MADGRLEELCETLRRTTGPTWRLHGLPEHAEAVALLAGAGDDELVRMAADGDRVRACVALEVLRRRTPDEVVTEELWSLVPTVAVRRCLLLTLDERVPQGQ